MEHHLLLAKSKEDFSIGRKLFQEYAGSLNFELCFQNFDQELNEIDVQYNQPGGALVLIQCGQEYVGCAGFRECGDKIAELKRMYIRPSHRGTGLGRILLERLLAMAKDRGYEKIRLDTMSSMESASRLYRKLGFYPIEAYRFNPDQNALFFEKRIL